MDDDSTGTEYDVFLSYAHRTELPLADEVFLLLQAEGLRVWRDQASIREGTSISASVERGISSSKLFLAFYSEAYADSLPCQLELRAAFIAAQGHGDVTRRILLVNPLATLSTSSAAAGLKLPSSSSEPCSTGHIEPLELRDASHFRATTQEEKASSARIIAQMARKTKGRLGAAATFLQPRWCGHRSEPRGCVGRLPDTWKVHSALWSANAPMISGTLQHAAVYVTGLAGIGKSFLVEDYALRFGAAYPGGIFVLNGACDYDSELIRVAIELTADKQIDAENASSVIGEYLRADGRPYLWFVDDLPALPNTERTDASVAARTRWYAPSEQGKTVITTQLVDSGWGGSAIKLGPLGIDEASKLLAAESGSEGSHEDHTTRDVAAELGGHPQAIAIAGRLIAMCAGRLRPCDLLRLLKSPERDGMEELISVLRPELPNGHERSIVRTLLASIRQLDEPALDVLRLASILASCPIPFDLADAALDRTAGVPAVGCAPAVAAVARLSLLEACSEHGVRGFAVHGLVRRVVQFYDSHRNRVDILRSRSIEALPALMVGVVDVRCHGQLTTHLAHARHLSSSVRSDVEAQALLLVARAYNEQGRYDEALELYKKILDSGVPLMNSESWRRPTEIKVLELQSLKGDQDATAVLRERRRGAFGNTDDLLSQLMRGKEAGDTDGANSESPVGSASAHRSTAPTAATAGACETYDLAGVHVLVSPPLDWSPTMHLILNTYRHMAPRRVVNGFLNAGGCRLECGDWDDAFHHTVYAFRFALETPRLGPKSPEAARALYQLGCLLLARPEFDAAQRVLRQALSLMQSVFGEGHPETAETRTRLEEVMIRQGNTC